LPIDTEVAHNIEDGQ